MITLDQVLADPSNDLLVIDFVHQQLKMQGCKAGIVDETADNQFKCLYRGPNGTKCAFGHLLPDEEYTEKMDDGPTVTWNIFDSFFHRYPFDRLLVSRLQLIHDSQKVENWEKEFADIRQEVVNNGGKYSV